LSACLIGLSGGEARQQAHDANVAPVQRVVHPLYEQLQRQLAAYEASWAQLPQTPVRPGPTLTKGAVGERVAALRHRLGLPSGERFDTVLAARVSAFQSAHGLPPTGDANAATVAALNKGAGPYEDLIQLNLDRLRALPGDPGRRYLLVDVAAARLWLYENGRPVHSMRVVVGKPDQQTPEMMGVIRYMVFNPYWNLPPDITRASIAPNATKYGPEWVSDAGYEVLSSWASDAAVVRPATIEWRAVAAGDEVVRVRQRPGPGNMMGRVKFMFPNSRGIYLHDTPHRRAFAGDARVASAGCVRVEDAERLARWLAGVGFEDATGAPEQRIDLAQPVPVYLIYLTASPGADQIVFRPDIYQRDRQGAST